MRLKSVRGVLLAACMMGEAACDHSKDAVQAQSHNPSPPSDSAAPTLNLPPDSGVAPAIDGDRALRYVKDIVKFGPRPLGSASHKKVEEYIDSALKGDQVEDDIFTADTPE